MVHTKRSGRPRTYLVPFVGAFLTVTLGLTLQANGAIAQVKGASSRSNAPTREPKSLSAKMVKPVTNPLPILHRDLLNLEEGQKGLQRQLESLTGATRRHADELARIDTLTDQLNRLASQQQQSTAMQQLLAVTIRSTRLLLMIILGMLLMLSGALLFFAYQVRQFGGFQLKDQKQIGAATSDAPDGAFEQQWKVGS